MEKITFETIRDQYNDNIVCMDEFLDTTEAEGLTIKEAFELYIQAMKETEKDRFFQICEVDDIREL